MKFRKEFFIANEAAMLALGGKLADIGQVPCVIFLKGELGAGKTTLVRGFLRRSGYQGIVKSPTYTLVEPYELKNHLVFHFDLYRLHDPQELENIGIRDYFTKNAICLIEWPERGLSVLPPADLTSEIDIVSDGRRVILNAMTHVGEKILQKLSVQST